MARSLREHVAEASSKLGTEPMARSTCIAWIGIMRVAQQSMKHLEHLLWATFELLDVTASTLFGSADAAGSVPEGPQREPALSIAEARNASSAAKLRKAISNLHHLLWQLQVCQALESICSKHAVANSATDQLTLNALLAAVTVSELPECPAPGSRDIL